MEPALRRDNSIEPIQRVPTTHHGLTHARTWEAPQRGLLQRALGAVVPGVKDYYDFKDAESYMVGAHLNPIDMERQEKEMQRSTQISGASRDESYALSQTGYDDQWGNKFENRSLGYATEDPRNYTYMRGADEMRDGKYGEFDDYAVLGSRTGTLYDDSVNNNRITGIDPYNVANVQYGSKFLGVFPRGYGGSVKENTGINPYVDKSHWQKQVDELGNRPIDSSIARHKDNTRMDLY
tara:strand:+ start:320 stop:1030 length:711 start_codon:yes stop_codon:yes gene_type:complete